MPLPNTKVAAALIDSYLNVRKQQWGLELPPGQDKVKIPDNINVRHKLDICIAILNKIHEARSFQDWLDLLDHLYQKETDEIEAQQNRLLIARILTNDPLIADVLHATRTYIISELKVEEQFQLLKSQNTGVKVELEKQILWDREHNASKDTISAKQKQLDAIDKTLLTRDDNDVFHIAAYETKLAPLDPASSVNDEKTFKQFSLDIQQGKRLLTVSERLLADHKRKQLEAPSTNAQAQSDAAKASAPKPAAAPKASPASAATPIVAPVPVKPAAQNVAPSSPKPTKQNPQPLINIDIDLDATPPSDQQKDVSGEASPVPLQKRSPSPAAFFQLPPTTATRRNPRRTTGAANYTEDSERTTPRAKRK